MSISYLGALIHTQPEKAKAQILEAIRASKGDRKKAAAALGTTHRSLYRYLQRLRLWDSVEAILVEEGLPSMPGPPRMSVRILTAAVQTGGDLPKMAKAIGCTVPNLKTHLAELDMVAEVNQVLAAAGIARRIVLEDA